MPVATVEFVTEIPHDTTYLQRFHLDTPRRGEAREGFVVRFGGWAIGTGKSRLESISLFVTGGGEVARAPLNVPRDDVAAAFPDDPRARMSGFVVDLSLLGVLHENTLHLFADFADGTRFPFLNVRIVHEQLVTAPHRFITPALLVSQGRTGTTWLMRLLACHPQIVVTDNFPYEDRLAQYWAHQAHVLSEPFDHAASATPSSFFNEYNWVGRNPFFDPGNRAVRPWLESSHVRALAEFSCRSIDDFYRQQAQAQGKSDPRVFAEKTVGENIAARTLRDLLPQTRRLFLFRDPRDMLASIIAFNEKRGFADFGMESIRSLDDYIPWLAQSTGNLYAYWKRSAAQVCRIRYEDLISEPGATLQRILGYLELDADAQSIDRTLRAATRETPGTAAHRTTRDADASIGRWRRDLKPDVVARCREAFAEVLDGLDYAES